MNIEKQVKKLYFLDFLGGFNLTDSIWMLLLVSRGFTLWQAGIAEGVFHAVSFLCEIPSGMVADLYGRKRTLIASWAVLTLSSVVMLFSTNFVWICMAFALNAFGYNLQSGTREALTYDSLLQTDRENDYLKVSSWQTIIYRTANAICRLVAGFAVSIGYQVCYGLRIVTTMAAGGVSTTLTEAVSTDISVTQAAPFQNRFKDLPRNLLKQTKETVSFLCATPIAVIYMLASAGLSGFIIMTSFLLQEHLTSGSSSSVFALGPLLFFVSLGGILGPKTAILLKKLHHRNAVLLTGITSGLFIALCGTASPLLSALGGFFIILCEEALCTLTDVRLNDMFPSAQRATLSSVFSMCFSLSMLIVSPIMGFLSDFFGTSATFYICGTAVMVFTVSSRFIWALLQYKKSPAC
ncbi:MAG: MFS transporter [Oscillospiraceae bacterium]|nr:MFS transporter [Oscillospiraceae bacterium]